MRIGVTLLLLAAISLPAQAGSITLDFDSPGTGSTLDVAPLVTGLGTITLIQGEIRDRDGDPEFNAAGASGDVLDIVDPGSLAHLAFGFDVREITFIYGGNDGVFDIEARNAANVVVDSFFQASTGALQPAGPITLSGAGIRSLIWKDPGNNFAPIDNVKITPEPASLALVALGIGAVLSRRRRKSA